MKKRIKKKYQFKVTNNSYITFKSLKDKNNYIKMYKMIKSRILKNSFEYSFEFRSNKLPDIISYDVWLTGINDPQWIRGHSSDKARGT